MTNSTNKTSLRTAALIAGLDILTMAIAAPFAELFVYPKLVVRDNAAETAENIMANETLFVSGVFGYLITLHQFAGCQVYVPRELIFKLWLLIKGSRIQESDY